MGISEETSDGVTKARESLLARLAARWEVLKARQGLVDFDVATWAREVRDAFASDRGGRNGFWRQVGISPKGDGKRHMNLAKVLDAVPSLAVWKALGGYCTEMGRVTRIAEPKARAAACKRIVDNYEQIRATAKPASVLVETRKAAGAILNAFPETKPTRTAAAAKAEARQKILESTVLQRNIAAEKHLNIARRFVRRLIESGYAFIADLAEPPEREALDLPAKAKKAKAS